MRFKLLTIPKWSICVRMRLRLSQDLRDRKLRILDHLLCIKRGYQGDGVSSLLKRLEEQLEAVARGRFRLGFALVP
jgi:hypothetical protein